MSEDLRKKLLDSEAKHRNREVVDELGELRAKLRRDKSQLRQMKIITILLWIFTIISLLTAYSRINLELEGNNLSKTFYLWIRFLSQWLPLITTISTVLLIVRTFSYRRRSDHLEIDARLARIESLLEKNAQDDTEKK